MLDRLAPTGPAITGRPRTPWPVVALLIVTTLSALAVALTAADHFTRLTMLVAAAACIVLRQTLRDPIVLAGLTIIALGAVLGWGLDFYDRIWWYDDLAHFAFSLVGTLAIGRLALPRFRAEPALLLPVALWLAWLGIGSLWEIGEWAADVLEGTTHSRGYLDTMTDMALNAAGAGIGAWVSWRWVARTPAAGLDA